jgi:hypothetical protein
VLRSILLQKVPAVALLSSRRKQHQQCRKRTSSRLIGSCRTVQEWLTRQSRWGSSCIWAINC